MPIKSAILGSTSLQRVFDQSNNTYSDKICEQINEKEEVITTIVSETIIPHKDRLSDRLNRDRLSDRGKRENELTLIHN